MTVQKEVKIAHNTYSSILLNKESRGLYRLVIRYRNELEDHFQVSMITYKELLLLRDVIDEFIELKEKENAKN